MDLKRVHFMQNISLDSVLPSTIIRQLKELLINQLNHPGSKMAHRRRNPSTKVTKAEKRLEAMMIIDNRNNRQINYGGDNNPLTTAVMTNQIEECKKLISEYNSMIETVDEKSRAIKNAEEKLGDLFTRVLAGGRSIFGVDSNEVEELGGTKKSERKKPIKYNKTTFNNLNNIST